jgi:hypothetical protein
MAPTGSAQVKLTHFRIITEKWRVSHSNPHRRRVSHSVHLFIAREDTKGYFYGACGTTRYSQRTGSRTLTTLCLGDEEQFSTALFQVWKAWVALAHEQLPNVIVHT